MYETPEVEKMDSKTGPVPVVVNFAAVVDNVVAAVYDGLNSKVNSVSSTRRFQLVSKHRANWFEIVDIERCRTKGN